MEREQDPRLVARDSSRVGEPIGVRIRAIAARQRSLITRAQLRALGMNAGAIDGRLRRGELTVLHRGVYLVGVAMVPGAAELAAVYACGRPTFVSHRSSGHLQRLLPQPAAVEVTVIGRRLDSRPGIAVHRTRYLTEDEFLILDGIPMTTPARTILDLAPALASGPLEQLVAEACARNFDTRRQLDSLLVRYPRRPGTRVLRELLERPNGPAFTKSRAERRLLELVRRAELPHPRANAEVLGYEVDLLWDVFKLVVEFDSHAFHAAKSKRERDSRRDQDLVRHGFAVIRMTWAQLTRHPYALIARLAMTMGARQSPSALSTARQ